MNLFFKNNCLSCNLFSKCFHTDEDDSSSTTSSLSSSCNIIVAEDAVELNFADESNMRCIYNLALLGPFGKNNNDGDSVHYSDEDSNESNSPQELSNVSVVISNQSSILIQKKESTMIGTADTTAILDSASAWSVVSCELFSSTNSYDNNGKITTGTWEFLEGDGETSPTKGTDDDHDEDEKDLIEMSSINSSFSGKSRMDDNTTLLFAEQIDFLCTFDLNGNDPSACRTKDDSEDSSYYTMMSDVTQGIAKLQQELWPVSRPFCSSPPPPVSRRRRNRP